MSQSHCENLAENLSVFRDSCHVYAVQGPEGKFWSMQETAGSFWDTPTLSLLTVSHVAQRGDNSPTTRENVAAAAVPATQATQNVRKRMASPAGVHFHLGANLSAPRGGSGQRGRHSSSCAFTY